MGLCAASVNSIGLALDIAGVVLLFFFGVPNGLRRDGAKFIPMAPSGESEIRKGKWHYSFSCAALALLVLGFTLQFVSTWI